MTAAESGSGASAESPGAGPDGPSARPDGGPSGGDLPGSGSGRLDWLAPESKDKPLSRDSVLSVRLRPAERERIERAAEALGFSASAYVRTRALGPDANIEGWRRAYELVLDLDEVADRGDVPAEAVRQFRGAFEALARAVFPDAEGGE